MENKIEIEALKITKSYVVAVCGATGNVGRKML